MMTDESDGIPLRGGRTAATVVRLGTVVRRSMGPRAGFTRRLLRLLEEKHFGGAPRFLGVDDQRREMLSFIEGDVPHQGVQWTDGQLVAATRIIREFHDVTAGSELAGRSEVVCHNDLAPWNIVLRGAAPLAFIDFDDAAPGRRVDDLAYFLWTFLELGGERPADLQAERVRPLCGSYGLAEGAGLVSALIEQQKRVLAMRERLARDASDAAGREFSAWRAVRIRSEMAWVQANRGILDAAAARCPGTPTHASGA
jgi:hypothetical protein